MKNY
jgi:hypothetical protein